MSDISPPTIGRTTSAYTCFLTEDTMLSVGAMVHKAGAHISSQPYLLLEEDLLLVCEGMSNQPGEECAVPHQLSTVFLEHKKQGSSGNKTLSNLVLEAHDRVVRERSPQAPWVGAGFVAASFQAEDLFLTNMGDIRLYLHTRSSLQQLTDDDTWAWQRHCAGEVTKEQARVSTEANVVTRLLSSDGFSDETTLIDKAYKTTLGDVYLLCNRGFWGVLPDDRIQKLINTGYRLYPDNDFAVAQMLVAAATSVKKDANISVVIARIKDIPFPIFVERGLATIEAENFPILYHLMEKQGGRVKELMRLSLDARAHFVYTTYTRYFEEGGVISPTVAAGYEQVLHLATTDSSQEYIAQTVDALLNFYLKTYIHKKEKDYSTFIKKLAATRERARGSEQKIDAVLCECIESIGDTGDKKLLRDAHPALSPLFPEAPQLENSVMHAYIQLSEKALTHGNISEAHELLRSVSLTPDPGDSFKTYLSMRIEKLYLSIAKKYAASKEVNNLVALYDEAKDIPSLSEHKEEVIRRVYNSGKKAYQTGNTAAARSAFATVLFIEPKHVDSLVSIAQLSINEQQYADALSLLEIALQEITAQQKNDTWAPKIFQKSAVYLLLATVYREEAKKDPMYASETAQTILRAKQCAPSNTTISAFTEETKEYFQREGRRYFERDNYASASSYLQAAQTLGASSDWLIWRIGYCHEVAGDYSAAEQVYTSIPTFKNAQIGLRRLAKDSH